MADNMTPDLAHPVAPLSVVVVGCGAVTQAYYQPTLIALQRSGEVGSVGYYDSATSRAALVANSHPHSCALSDWSQVVNSPADLAIVASPPSWHGRQVQDLLLHDKHVLCEKPFTLDHAEASDLVNLAQKRTRLCAVGMVRRFSTATQFLKALCDETERPVTKIEWLEGAIFRWPVATVDYFQPSFGNGLLWDIGAHVLDLVTWWLGFPNSIHCQDDAVGGTEANCQIDLKFPAAQVRIRLSRDCSLPNRIRLERSGDQLSCQDVFTDRVCWKSEAAPLAIQGELNVPNQLRGPNGFASGISFDHCFHLQLLNVLHSIRGIDRLLVSGADVLPGLKLLTQASAQRTLMELPWWSSDELQAAQRLRAMDSPRTKQITS